MSENYYQKSGLEMNFFYDGLEYIPDSYRFYHTTSLTSKGHVHSIDFYDGSDGSIYKSNRAYIRCVRETVHRQEIVTNDEKKKHEEVLSALGIKVYPVKNVYVDFDDKLMWQDDQDMAKGIEKQWLTFKNRKVKKYMDTTGDTAATYCQRLILAGYDDWRLPNNKELYIFYSYPYNSIQNINKTSGYSYIPAYWSSESSIEEREEAWYYSPHNNSIDTTIKVNSGYVRCVRDGK